MRWVMLLMCWMSMVRAGESPTPVRYGHEQDGLRVIFDLSLPALSPAHTDAVERVLLTTPVLGLAQGFNWQDRVDRQFDLIMPDLQWSRARFPDAEQHKNWFSDSSITTTWATQSIVSLRFERRWRMGGKETNIEYQSFLIAPERLRHITLDDLIVPKHQPAFCVLLEKELRVQREIPITQTLQEAGLTVEALPARLPVITAAGVTVDYPPYCIAPYSAGTISITIPKTIIRPLLEFDPWQGE